MIAILTSSTWILTSSHINYVWIKKKDSQESGLPTPYFNASGMSDTIKFANCGYVCAKLLN